jgi:hypothetical protein
MSYLLYCIFRESSSPDVEIPAGVDAQPVLIVNHEGLGAGVSELVRLESPLDISNVLAYERVVESFYRQMTVIPLRYGCRVEHPSEAVSLLATNHREYGALLRELEGLAEMGIQVLLDGSSANEATDLGTAPPEAFVSQSSVSGAAYLAAKRVHYLGTDQAVLRQEEVVERVCSSLSGLFVRRKVELAFLSRTRLLSLYFLVARGSVERFRQVSRQLSQRETVRMLLSGPWPPYNFVESSKASGMS